MQPENQGYFVRKLLIWNDMDNNRQMPWKGEKDPYKIWLSEVILQQTRVEQGWEYYNRFIRQFPHVYDLAQADDGFVFKMWEGLGYYQRCRNLLKAARFIVDKYNGKFPVTYNEIIDLPGVGAYTASAIASFAFDLPHAVVDGNVLRVLSRFFGFDTPIDSTEGKKLFNELAQQLLPKDKPGLYNQAIMDFGATVCKPKLPECKVCPLRNKCVAFQTQQINQLPVKLKRIEKKSRYFHFWILEHNNQVLIQQRGNKDVWKELHQFPLVETLSDEHYPSPFVQWENLQLSDVSILASKVKQELTHQSLTMTFYKANVTETRVPKGYFWVKKSKLSEYAFPKVLTSVIDKFLNEK